MKSILKAGAAILALMLLGGSAWADGGRNHHHHRPHSSVQLGFYWGVPWGPPFYPAPVYAPRVYVPPVVIASPPVYIERQSAPLAQTFEPGYWYYCNEAQAYYPYVRQCAGPWQKVQPQPPQ